MSYEARVRTLEGLGLPQGTISKMRAVGIATVEQLIEHLDRQRGRVEKLLPDLGSFRPVIPYPDPPSHVVGEIPVVIPPLTGVTDPAIFPVSRSNSFGLSRTDPAGIAAALRSRLAPMDLPSKVVLHRWMTPVQNQGPHGFCVGFGSTANREFLARRPLSCGWTYRGAKSMDGRPDVEGSLQIYAMEFMHRIGCVPTTVFNYEDAIRGRPLEPLHAAARHRVSGYVDLMLPGHLDLMPKLMKALLAGKFCDDLGPQPISISIATYDSFLFSSTTRSGLLSLPLPGERRQGGHAMCVVGYVDAHDHDGLYGMNYFIVRNSFGERWAAQNPLGLPGHALIPDVYFADERLLWESLICLAEPSPVRGGWHIADWIARTARLRGR